MKLISKTLKVKGVCDCGNKAVAKIFRRDSHGRPQLVCRYCLLFWQKISIS